MNIDKVCNMIDELIEPMEEYRYQLVKIEAIKYNIKESKDLGDSEFLQSLLDLELKINEDSKTILTKILEQKSLEFAIKIKEMDRRKIWEHHTMQFYKLNILSLLVL